MTTTKWNKYVLLMWKNWLLQWRHKVQTIVEILIPVLFSGLLVLIRSLVDPEVFKESTIYTPTYINNLEDLRNVTRPSAIDMRFIYSPKNDILESIVRNASEYLKIGKLIAFTNAHDLEKYLFSKNPLAGIVFNDGWGNITELPDKLDYNIRFPGELRTAPSNPLFYNWRTDLLYPIFQTGGPRNRDSNEGGCPPGYLNEGFLHVQNAISKVFIEMKSSIAVPELLVQRYPYPPFTQDVLLQGLESFVSIIILLSFVYPCINTVKFITNEKEKQLKEAMKIMGLPSWLHWTAWFSKSMIFMIITTSLIVVLVKISWYPDTDVSVFTYTGWPVLWLFLILYSITTIMFCFMLSVFFSKANTASAVAGLVWFLFYSPYTFTQQNYELLSLGQKLTVSLFSNTAMAYGFQLILRHEGTGEGLQWDNLWRPVTPDDDLSVGLIMIMLILDAFIYLVITLYVEKILPGDFGVPEKWYFPFTKTFWCGYKEYVGVEDVFQNNQNKKNMEPDPVGMYAGVQIKDLRKVYSNKKVAVQGLSMNMFEDQITVLLGHNGAGKTTTMSMLTGMFPPTSGTALINNKDIRSDIDGVRASLGLCPQHNILFDELTVREHIIFYSRLKGLDNEDIEKEIIKYVDLLELQPKIHTQASMLSGGMQRKLSVGVALCGNSKVVLCDEPTSGMDPAARRALWDLLQKEKKGRTILLSTHFMDEADILGDRIAIMSDGELRASGSSFFLKKKFGVGYHLICVKGPKCNANNVTALLRKYVDNIIIDNDIGTELSYQLSEKYSAVFQTMLKDLEDNSEALGVVGYGVSLTTLEEVFMKVGTDNKIEDIPKKELPFETNNGTLDYEMGSVSTLSSTDSKPLLKGPRLTTNQILAMFEKKFLHTIRNWILLFLQILIPVMFLIITILIVRTWAGGSDLPPLKLDLSSYVNSVTVMEVDPNETNDTLSYNIGREYEALFANSPVRQQLHIISSDFQNYILKLGDTLQSRINARYLAAVTIKEKNITAWFNNQPFHTAPLSLNLLHNAILKGSGCGHDCHIGVTNQPMPFTTASRIEMLQAGNNMGFQLAFNTGFAMSFVSAFYILFYIKERVSRAKLLQFVSGVNVFTFWITAFIWDFITFILTAMCSIITLIIFQEDGWSTFSELGRTFIILVCFGFSMLPVTYLASMVFTIPSTGFTRMAIFNIFSGIACFSVVFILSFPNFNLKNVADGLTWFFLIFPHFSLSQGLNNLNIINTVIRTCDRCVSPCIPDKIPLCRNRNYFGWEAPGVGRNIFYLILVGVVTFLILLLIEYRVLESIFYKCKSLIKRALQPHSEDEFMDSDVMEEKNRINNMPFVEVKQHNLIIQNMTKLYNNFRAVNQISVGVDHSECFGLLGVNGAGKTSTFKMLTGDEKISYGEAWVKGISLKNDMNSVHQEIGYCPQFDALIEDLTGRETLRIFCLLRGVQRDSINSVSFKLATDLNFTQHIDKKVREYSGGNKRKLSTAVALIGNPAVVYLDEPTTGMDPGAKRQLWNMVCKIRNSGKSIVLTSHSMEECEALCTRLAIMVNGEFKCIGSTQYLKNKFSKGFVLTIKINKSGLNPNDVLAQPMNVKGNLDKIKEFISRRFADSYLKEEYQGLLTYYIPTANLKWSSMFGIMEEGKTALNIEDYSLSQTSLEQVFLSFTKYQREENKNN